MKENTTNIFPELQFVNLFKKCFMKVSSEEVAKPALICAMCDPSGIHGDSWRFIRCNVMSKRFASFTGDYNIFTDRRVDLSFSSSVSVVSL